LARWFSEGTPVLKVVEEESESNAHAPAAVGGSLLDEIVRDGARQRLAAALQAEVAAYVEDHAEQLDENGRRLVVRNGRHQPREGATAAGAVPVWCRCGAGVVPVRAPGVNDTRTDVETGERKRFASAILPALGQEVSAGRRGVAAALPARFVLGRLRAITLRLAINKHASDSGHSRGFRSCDGIGATSLKRAGSCATAWSQ